jgi:hypothetical protein
MAKAIVQKPAADAPVGERALWVLEQLRQQPGAIVSDEAGRWLRLDRNTSLIPAISELLPGLTVEQCKGLSRWLGDEGLRRAENTGGGTYAHFILLESDTAEPEADDQPVTADELHRAGHALMALAEKVEALEKRLADAQRELAATKAELAGTEGTLATVRGELDELRSQQSAGQVELGSAAVLFRTGLETAAKLTQQ